MTPSVLGTEQHCYRGKGVRARSRVLYFSQFLASVPRIMDEYCRFLLDEYCRFLIKLKACSGNIVHKDQGIQLFPFPICFAHVYIHKQNH